MRGSSLSSLRRLLPPLDDRGNVAIVAALAMAPICIAGMGAVDLARATSVKSQLQDALDAAALAAARSNATTNPDLKAQGDRYLGQNLKLGDGLTLKSSDFRVAQNGRVVGEATVQFKPFVAGLVTGGDMDVSASTEVVRAGVKVEIALVLDTTGSMTEGTKLQDMKDAASSFVTKMEDASKKTVETNAVKISLVPFSSTVRLDTAVNRTKDWLDQNGVSPINDQIFTTATGTQHANRFALFDTIGTPWAGCVEMREAPYDVQEDTPSTATPATLYTPMFAVDEPDVRTKGYGSDFQNNYLNDGTSSNDWRVRQGSIAKYKAKSGLNGSLGPNRGCALAPMRQLTTDFAAMRSWISGLNANGNTNIPIGLMWGWNTLTPHAPFADGVAYGTPKHKKIIVLMTDGENTIAQRDTPNDGTYAATGYVWQNRVLKADLTPIEQGSTAAARTAALDSRLKLLCENIKKKNIDIYTIRVEVNTGDSTLLKNCASGRDYYYDVKDSTTLTAVFNSVAGQIAALHLSR